MKFLDRITQQKIDKLPVPISMGRYLFIPKADDCMNGILLEPNQCYYLVPDKNLNCEISSTEQNTFFDFKKELGVLTKKEIQSNLEDISNELNEKKQWNDVIKIIPLIRNIEKLLDIHHFEKQLEEWMFHIQDVCYKPEMKLTRISEKMPVSRAKRVPLKAINYLAAHSEDWERRKFLSVIPKAIISERLEDEIKIYENIVTARLLDHLLYYIQERINGIKRINQFQKALEKILDDYSSGDNNKKQWYRKVERTYQLCGEAYFNNGIERNSTLGFLENLEKELLKLQNSGLYKSIPKQYQISRTLKKTNLLSNHKHYKYIALLWEKWLLVDWKESKEERFENLQKQNKSFLNFTLVVLFRAFDQLEFSLGKDDMTKWRDREIIFKSEKKYPWVEIKIQLLEKETIQFSVNKTDFKLIPIIESVPEETEIPDKTILIMYKDENTTPKDNRIFISPEEIDSTEELARMVRKKILNELLEVYPVKLDLHNYSLEADLKKIDGIEIIEEEKKKKLVFQQLIPENDLNPVFKNAKEKLKSYGKQKEYDIQQLKNFEDQIKEKLEEIKGNVYHCIHEQCNEESLQNFSLRDNHCFLYTCSSCGCEWGIEISEGKRKPFFHVKGYKEMESSIPNLGMDWI